MVTFGGVNIDSGTAVDNTKLYITDISLPMKKGYTRHKVQIPGRPGSWDFGGSVATDYDVSIEVLIVGTNKENALERARKLEMLLTGKKELIISGEEKIHMAQVYNETGLSNLGARQAIRGVIDFECQAEVVHETGTASSGTDNTLTDTAKTWEVDQWEDYYVRIVGGTGEGQYRKISSNTTDTLTVEESWATNPDGTSEYEIFNF